MSRATRVAFLAAASAAAAAGCRESGRAPAPPKADFILEAGDSSYWVQTGPAGVRVRGVPMRIARVDGAFNELYIADDDHSYPDAIITGQNIFRRDLRSGDSSLVFRDTLVAGVARWYAEQHPTEKALGPDDDLPDEPRVNATSNIDLLGQFGRFLSISYTADIQLNASDEEKVARRLVVDLHSGTQASVADIVGDKNAAYVTRKGESLFRQTLDSVLTSHDARAGAAAAAIGDFRFDPSSFELVLQDNVPAIRFIAPGAGRRAQGLTLPLPPIAVASPNWWSETTRGLSDPDSDVMSDHWKHGAYTVRVDYLPEGNSARASLVDSTGRSFGLGTISAPARRIYWLDAPEVDSATRAALIRAFDEAALYSEDTRTAMTPTRKDDEKPGRFVSESCHEMSEIMMPQHANNLGHVFGGVILSMMDRCAAVAALRHARNDCVTVSVDRVDFREPIYLGDLVIMKASVNYTGRTSMEIGVRVECENLRSGVRRHTNSCYLTFVAVDADGRPVPVPAVIPKSAAEKRRYAAAEQRRRRRLEERVQEGKHA